MNTLTTAITTPLARTNSLSAEDESLGPGGIRRGTTPLIRYAKRLRPALNSFLSRFSLVGDQPVTDPSTFAWIEPILAEVPAIQAELHTILRQEEAIPPFRDFAPGHERIVERKDWRSFFFWGYGYPVERNIQRCPRTAAAVQGIPGLISAIYSVVGPGAHIKRHRGVCKAIMTAHIALKVPAARNRCRMDVDGRAGRLEGR